MFALRRSWAVGLLLSVICLAGCSQSGPFPVTQVTGQVKFAKPVGADRVVIRFIPQVSAEGKSSAIPAEGSVDPASGACSGLTTLTPGDGAIVGRHKVILIALKNGPDGEKPVDTVPPKYRDPKTTPLEYEVKSGAPPFEFTVDAK